MTRLLTKKLRDGFNLSFTCKIDLYKQVELIGGIRHAARMSKKIRTTEKQRILILRRVVK